MSKKNETASSVENVVDEQGQGAQQPKPSEMEGATSKTGTASYIDELTKNGQAIIEAKTREELAELVENIPADISYAVGAVGQNYDRGTYQIQVNLTKK